MKTSTKLLIIFFSCIPISLWAYNYILKNEYTAGRFTRDYYPDWQFNYVERKTPDFKYIVIDGALRSPGNTPSDWKPRILIDSSKTSSQQHNTITIAGGYEQLFQTTVKNDTLYITFFTKNDPRNIDNSGIDGVGLVKINAAKVLSVKASNAYISIVGKLSGADSLTLATPNNGQFDIYNLKINKLNIDGSGYAQLNIEETNHIRNLYYTLGDSSILRLKSHPVQQFHPGKIDSRAGIEITGKAIDLQKNLR